MKAALFFLLLAVTWLLAARFWPGYEGFIDRLAQSVSAKAPAVADRERPPATAGVEAAQVLPPPERALLQPVVVSAAKIPVKDLVDQREATATPDSLAEDATAAVDRPLALIRFAFDSAELNAAGREQVAAAALFLREVDSLSPVIITGFADTVGSADYNLELSQRRAGAVAMALSALGVDGERLRVEGRGSDAALPGLPEGEAAVERGERMVWVELGAELAAPTSARAETLPDLL
ncbi:OmpA family protein [Parahaliea aestuarii]|uniref:OmpA family protein n=1 Tax=Parahaliea aestuarii TaxID=1852021 RepID=UPI001650C540|nr:OmpA family protein [Parahaliea aestuarii]